MVTEASIRREDVADIDEDADDVKKDENQIEESVHHDIDDKHYDGALPVSEHDDPGDDDENENSDEGGPEMSDATYFIKDLKEAKIANEKLQEEMDLLKSKFDEVLKSEVSKDKDDSEINKDGSEGNVSNKANDKQESPSEDRDDEEKPADNNDLRKPLVAPQLDGETDKNGNKHEEDLEEE